MRTRQAAAAALALACAAAVAAQPPEESGKTLPPPRPLHYKLVPGKSIFRFELPTTLHVVTGQIGAWSGSVDVDAVDPGVLHARIDIKAASLVTGSERRDSDMHEKVLLSQKYPDIVFVAETYRGDLSGFRPGAVLTAELFGSLTIDGATRPVQTSVECAVMNDHAVLVGAVPLHWKDFGLRDMSRWFNKVKDPLTVIFRLWAVPEGP